MSDPQPTPSSGGASSIVSTLTSVQAILVVVGSLTGTAVLIAGNLCKLPLVSSVCSAPQPTPTPSPSATARTDAEADFDKRVAALNIQRDITLEGVNLKVYHQASKEDPLVEGVLVGLKAAGFSVDLNLNEAQLNLSNVQNVDQTPGMIAVKSIAARKALRPVVRAAILKAMPTMPYTRVKESDDDIPADDAAKVKRAGEIQVDVF
jgi:hypothetical protein